MTVTREAGEGGFKVNYVDAWRAHRNSMAIDEVFNTVEGDSEWKEYVTEERIEKGLRYTQIDEQVEAKLLAETSQKAQQPPVAETPTTPPQKSA